MPQLTSKFDRMRHAATRAMLERQDVIIIASVSCIYGIGSPESYSHMTIKITCGEETQQREFINQLVELQFTRNDIAPNRGSFRVRGDVIDIFPAHLEDEAWRISFFGDEIDDITAFDPLTGEKFGAMQEVTIYANSHYVTPRPRIESAIISIKQELKQRLEQLHSLGKTLEAQRLEQRTKYDLEMMASTGSCKGIENYSRYLTGAAAGDPPPTLFHYLSDNAIVFVDESHVTLPQIRGMYNGDAARKHNLVEHGFRLPSAKDNRPLKFEEWDEKRPNSIFVSATPSKIELEKTDGEFIEQIIRPTGLLDPPCFIKPVETQVDDLFHEIKEQVTKGLRTLVTTLTKKMAEQLTDYLAENNIRVKYLHSDVETLERVEIIRDLRLGNFDVLVGVNLLREGLDIPECGLVAILDADKEGFLRSKTALIQTIGRAARNADGKVILYADKMTDSIIAALEETNRRREIQQKHNEKHGITPKTIKREVADSMGTGIGGEMINKNTLDYTEKYDTSNRNNRLKNNNIDKDIQIKMLRDEMLRAAANLDFEQAAKLRDEINSL